MPHAATIYGILEDSRMLKMTIVLLMASAFIGGLLGGLIAVIFAERNVK